MAWNFSAAMLRPINTLAALVALLHDRLAELFGFAMHYDREAELAFGATVRPNGQRTGSQSIRVTTDDPFTVANPDKPREGVTIVLDFVNDSEGSIGAVTFGSAYVLDGAFVAPAIDEHAYYSFLCSRDGKYREIERSVGQTPAPPTGPTAGFTVSKANLVVTITNTAVPAAGTTIVSWDYNWGDGTPHGTTASPTHTYATAGQKTITQTVTDSNAATDTFVRTPTLVDPGDLELGIPFGPIGLFSGTDTLEPISAPFNMSADAVTAGVILARITFAKNNGLQLLLRMTGGGRRLYTTNAIFDRRKWTTRQQSFNTSAIIAAVTASDSPCIANEVMDEPGNDGGPGNQSNSWGPRGTMCKSGRTPQEVYFVRVAGNAAAGDQSVIVDSLEYPLFVGDTLTFLTATGGPLQGRTMKVRNNEVTGNTVIECDPLPQPLLAGYRAESNSVDNMVQECKNIFGASFPVGVFMDYSLMPTQSFKVLDFMISQWRWKKNNGDIDAYIASALALGARDGHNMAFSNNVIDGGIPSTPATGCPDVWICGDNTGGRGSYCPNCNQTPAQVEEYGKKLGAAGVFGTIWTYYNPFFSREANVTAWNNIATYMAGLTRKSLLR